MTKFTDHFNSTTIKGRANVAKVTYASFAAIYLYSRFKKSRNKTKEISDNKATTSDSKGNSGASSSSGDKPSLENYRCPKCECNNKPIIEESDVKAEGAPKDLTDAPPASIEAIAGKKESCKLFYNQDKNGTVAESADKSLTIKCEPENESEYIDVKIEEKSLKTDDDIDLWWVSN